MGRTHALGLTAALIVAGCGELEPLTEYRPVVDPERTNMPRFESDLEACRSIALRVEAEYEKRRQEQMEENLVAGLIVGALVGAVAGAGSDYQSDYIAAGAASGALAGVAENDYTHDLVTFGPRRVVDRCMAERGYVILNDIGRG